MPEISALAKYRLYPRLLPARAGQRPPGLDIYNAASPDGSLRIAPTIYGPGMLLVIAYLYLAKIFRRWKRTVAKAFY